MLGFTLALGTAVLKAATDVAFKTASRTVPYDVTLLVVQRAVEALLSLGLILLLRAVWDSYALTLSTILTPYFAFLVLSSALINGCALYLTIKALRISDISVVSPMSQLTPAILLVTSPLMLGESVSLFGAVGVLLIVCGSYALGMSSTVQGAFSLWRPMRALASDTGVRYALVASVLYGITSNIDKLGGQASDPFVWTCVTALTLTIVLGGVLVVTNRNALTLSTSQLGLASIPGLTSGVGSILQMFAIALWPVPYVIAIKRLSSLVSIFSGWYWFNEKDIGWRLVGAVVMLAGTVCIVLFG